MILLILILFINILLYNYPSILFLILLLHDQNHLQKILDLHQKMPLFLINLLHILFSQNLYILLKFLIRLYNLHIL